MMRSTCTFLLLCVLGFVRGGPSPDDQILSMVCDISGTITATLTTSPWVKDVSATCIGGSAVPSIDGNALKISGCPKNTDVNIKMFDVPPSPSTKIVSQGHKRQSKILSCRAIGNNTDKEVESGPIHTANDVNGDRLEETEGIHLVMELWNTSGAIVSTINLAEDYTLVIGGAGTYNTFVKQCNVSATTDFTGSEIVYDGKTKSSSSHVMDTFTAAVAGDNLANIGEKVVNQKATLHGFRLIGSSSVYLKCTVKVCPTGPCPQLSYKRKAKKHTSVEHDAVLRFEVRDNILAISANSATKATDGNLLKVMILTAAMYLLY